MALKAVSYTVSPYDLEAVVLVVILGIGKHGNNSASTTIGNTLILGKL